jgi:hypothetical protein
MIRYLLLSLCLCCPALAATITHEQGAHATAAAAAVSTAMGASVGLGDMVLGFSKTAATSAPTVAFTNAGTAACTWQPVVAAQFVGSQVGYSIQTCVVTMAGTLTTTATWTGGSGSQTDLALGEYNSSTGWTVVGSNNFIAATSTISPSPVTFCATGTTVIPIPAGFLAVAVCGQFNVSQTWSSTVGAYTNRTDSSFGTTGWYDTIPSSLAPQSFTTTITSDIGYAVIVAFAPNGTTAPGKALIF